MSHTEDFSAIPDTEFNDYVLAELRCSFRRAQLVVNEIECIGLALKHGLINTDEALERLQDARALDFLLVEYPEEPPSACLIPIVEAAAAQLS